MTNIFYILVGITVLFFVFLVVKEFFKRFKKKFCVICIAVSISWISLLILYWLGVFEDKIIIALLMGQTILGIYYLIEEKIEEELRIFRLPFLLTLIAIGYSLLVMPGDIIRSIVFLLILWLIFTLFYLYRNNQNMNSFVNKIIECCKRW